MTLGSDKRSTRVTDRLRSATKARSWCARSTPQYILAALLVCLVESSAVATTVHNTVVIVANMLDATVPASSQQVADAFFNGADSVAAFYAESTFGNLTFPGIVLDPVTIPYTSTSTCLYLDWADAARHAAVAAYNFDFTNYNRIVYVLPPCEHCFLDGVATINGRHSWNFGKPLEHGIYSHELGHNLGFLHANTPGVEGGDESSTMGFGDRMVHFNAVEKYAAGWIPPERAVDVAAAGVYQVAPLESLAGADPLLLRIEAQASTERYYVSYRRPLGFDANLPLEFQDKLSVHSWSGVGSSTLRAVLADGDLFTDPASGVFIKLVDHGEQSATVSVTSSFPAAASGDFNLDGYISAADLDQWRKDFGQNAGSDSDGDRDSDGLDFLHWQNGVDPTGSASPILLAASASIPEPAAIALALSAVVFASRSAALRGWQPVTRAS